MIRIVVTGRMVKDVEVAISQSNNMKYTRDARIAADGRYNPETKERETMFFDLKGFGAIAERMAKFLRKGSQTTISGSLQERTYTTKDGEEKKNLEIMVDDFTLPPLPPRDNGEVKSNVPSEQPMDNNLPEINDADLPF